MLQLEHKQSELYQRALELAKEVYRLSETFPDSERSVLMFTLRRLSVSLCQDIAMAATKTNKKQRRFFETCVEHCVALDAQLELALAVNLVTLESVGVATTLLQFIYKSCCQNVTGK